MLLYRKMQDSNRNDLIFIDLNNYLFRFKIIIITCEL